MRDVEVRDLLDLTAASEVTDPHEKLSQLYLWKYEYNMTAAKAITATGASLLISLILAQLQAKSHALSKELIAGLIGAVVLILLGGFQFFRLRIISKQYVAAHYLLSDVVKMRRFLQLYTAGKPR